MSVWLTLHTEDTLVKAEDARLFQFCNSPLIIGHYRGKIGNVHTDNRQKRNVLYMIRKSTLKIQHPGLETANRLTSEVSISHSIHAVQ